MTPLDADWLAEHPLPTHATDTDKNARGRVVLAGGARFVPGALRLTGEAVLRAGAGKLQMATVADVATALGVLVPEAAMIALPPDEEGEIADAAIALIEDAVAHCDAFILGPGMSGKAERLVEALLGSPREGLSIVLDAAALTACSDLSTHVRAHGGRAIMTPHHGEMALLTGHPVEHIADNAEAVACEIAGRFAAVVILKSERTIVAAPDGPVLAYEGGGIGLATGGSGDVLAGIAGGLLARGADPLTAAAWAVWLHGEAGKRLAESMGPIGYLARELPALVPRLMNSTAPREPIGFR